MVKGFKLLMALVLVVLLPGGAVLAQPSELGLLAGHLSGQNQPQVVNATVYGWIQKW